jgi:amino acid adenylation domain-containing protein
MIGHFRVLLEAIAVNPATRLSDLQIITDEERHHAIRTWNASEAAFPSATLHSLFERQVARVPERVALECNGQTVRYRDLDARANRLAARLRSLGVARDMPVGVMLPRSPDLIVALLAVLKAGGAYLPLDPAFPAQRLLFMLSDSRAQVVLTDSNLARALGSTAARVLTLDTPAGESAPTQHAGAGQTPDDLAYLIYTSGSTGQPKGVQVPHRNVVNFLASMQRCPGIREDDRVYSVTTIAFDISVLELFLPLSVGATICLADDGAVRDPSELARELTATRATMLQATPATWRLLIESGWSGNAGLTALCGGEALPRDLAKQLFDRCGSVWNLYGPTETTVWSAVHKLAPDMNRVPIGLPIANTQFYVLDGKRRPTPLGVPGELWIGGAGVARGYHDRPDLTAERFVPNPFTGSGRMYRTGDLVRREVDGTLDFIGRVDFQVKLHGFRIELGEIETVLRGHPAIREAIALVREDQVGDRRLVMYWTRRERAYVTDVELRRVMVEALPMYMVPSVLVELDELPMTPNGKVDRSRLPAPAGVRPALESSFAPPSNDLERQLADVWCDVLKVEKVGVLDNFFDLGGSSLLLVQVQRRTRELLQRDVPLVDFFRWPTVAALAEHLRTGSGGPFARRSIGERVARQKDALSRGVVIQDNR